MWVNLTPAQRREWQHPPLRRNVFALREFVTAAAAAAEVAAEAGGAQIGDSFPLQLATVTVTFFSVVGHNALSIVQTRCPRCGKAAQLQAAYANSLSCFCHLNAPSNICDLRYFGSAI